MILSLVPHKSPFSPCRHCPNPKPANTLVVYKGSGTNTFTTLHYKRDFKLLRFGNEMEGKFLGLMEV
jgi:hypothetical protein